MYIKKYEKRTNKNEIIFTIKKMLKDSASKLKIGNKKLVQLYIPKCITNAEAK